jgi:Uma2 family endonuclease
MKAITINQQTYTFEEYLALEEQSEVRHEFHNGAIRAMAGGSEEHSLISTNISTALNNFLDTQNKDCRVYNADLKVRSETFNKSVYPDVMMICGDRQYYNNSKSVVLNPLLLIEVLSKSTKDYDKGEKFELYRSIPAFKEYVLVYQTVPMVQTWYKQDEDLWKIDSARGLDSAIYLNTLDFELPLAEIYKRLTNLQAIPQDLFLAY